MRPGSWRLAARRRSRPCCPCGAWKRPMRSGHVVGPRVGLGAWEGNPWWFLWVFFRGMMKYLVRALMREEVPLGPKYTLIVVVFLGDVFLLVFLGWLWNFPHLGTSGFLLAIVRSNYDRVFEKPMLGGSNFRLAWPIFRGYVRFRECVFFSCWYARVFNHWWWGGGPQQWLCWFALVHVLRWCMNTMFFGNKNMTKYII